METEIFKKCIIQIDKLISYGFIKENNYYVFKKNFMNNKFMAEIKVLNNQLSGKIYDIDFNCEYNNINVKSQQGSFVNKVRDEYKKILLDIKENCTTSKYFILDQTNRVANYIVKKYGDEPEFLWKKYDGFGVFRNKDNKKWYAIIMNINEKILGGSNREIEIIDVKSYDVEKLLKQKGYQEAYHMNKKNWITIVLDDTLKDEEIFKMIDSSYENIKNLMFV